MTQSRQIQILKPGKTGLKRDPRVMTLGDPNAFLRARGMGTRAEGGGCVDANFASVSLLAGFDGTAGADADTVGDESSNARGNFTKNGNATLVATEKLAGSTSLRITGSLAHDYVSLADDDDWRMTGEFTLDVLVRFETLKAGTFPTLVGQFVTSGNQRAFLLRVDVNDDSIGLVISANGTATSLAKVAVAGGLQTDTTYHVRANRNSSDEFAVAYRALTDTSMTVGSATTLAGMFNSTAALSIGDRTDGTDDGVDALQGVKGRIDEVRITSGVARDLTEIESFPLCRK